MVAASETKEKNGGYDCPKDAPQSYWAMPYTGTRAYNHRLPPIKIPLSRDQVIINLLNNCIFQLKIEFVNFQLAGLGRLGFALVTADNGPETVRTIVTAVTTDIGGRWSADHCPAPR